MTTVIIFVGDPVSDEISAVMRLATEIKVADADDRLRERKELAARLLAEYRERPPRARPAKPPKEPVVVEAVPAYAEQCTAFGQPDWSGVIEYPYYEADEQPPTWGRGGEVTMWNGRS